MDGRQLAVCLSIWNDLGQPYRRFIPGVKRAMLNYRFNCTKHRKTGGRDPVIVSLAHRRLIHDTLISYYEPQRSRPTKTTQYAACRYFCLPHTSLPIVHARLLLPSIYRLEKIKNHKYINHYKRCRSSLYILWPCRSICSKLFDTDSKISADHDRSLNGYRITIPFQYCLILFLH